MSKIIAKAVVGSEIVTTTEVDADEVTAANVGEIAGNVYYAAIAHADDLTSVTVVVSFA